MHVIYFLLFFFNRVWLKRFRVQFNVKVFATQPSKRLVRRARMISQINMFTHMDRKDTDLAMKELQLHMHRSAQSCSGTESLLKTLQEVLCLSRSEHTLEQKRTE